MEEEDIDQEVDQRLQCVLELPVFLHLAESFWCYVMTDELMSGWELAAARRCNIYIYIIAVCDHHQQAGLQRKGMKEEPELVQSTMRLQCVHDHMMRSSSSAAMNRGRRGSPFTSRQWAELEHQALIFKYMMAGLNVPEELLYPIRRSVAASLMINAASMTTTHNGCRWDGSLTS